MARSFGISFYCAFSSERWSFLLRTESFKAFADEREPVHCQQVYQLATSGEIGVLRVHSVSHWDTDIPYIMQIM